MMVVALFIALFLCVVLFSIGVLVWWTPIPLAVKLALSAITILPAIAFGAIIIECLRY